MNSDERRINRRVKLRDLDTLLIVAKAGGMRRAAEQLHLSQPAVSKAIAALEASLGCALFERSRTGVEVTAYGRALILRAEVMFDELQQSVRDLDYLADPDAGEIRLACSEPVMAGLVSAAIERMSKLHPKVTYRVESGSTVAAQLRFLIDRESDFILTRPHGVEVGSNVRVEPLFHDKLHVVVSKNSPWANRRKITLAELADAPWIISETELFGGDSPLVKSFEAVGVPLPTSRIVTGSVSGRFVLMASGYYVTVMPQAFLHFGAARYGLKILPIELGRWHIPNSLLTLASHAMNPATEKFLTIVRELSRPLAL